MEDNTCVQLFYDYAVYENETLKIGRVQRIINNASRRTEYKLPVPYNHKDKEKISVIMSEYRIPETYKDSTHVILQSKGKSIEVKLSHIFSHVPINYTLELGHYVSPVALKQLYEETEKLKPKPKTKVPKPTKETQCINPLSNTHTNNDGIIVEVITPVIPEDSNVRRSSRKRTVISYESNFY